MQFWTLDMQYKEMELLDYEDSLAWVGLLNRNKAYSSNVFHWMGQVGPFFIWEGPEKPSSFRECSWACISVTWEAEAGRQQASVRTY